MRYRINKKILIAGILLLATTAVLAWVPVYNGQSVFGLLAGQTRNGEMPAPQENEKAADFSAMWKELEKIEAANGTDSVLLTGTVRLYDNLDDHGVKEEQRFAFDGIAGNEHLKLESFERIKLGETYFLIDHEEPLITIQEMQATDSISSALKMMNTKQFRKMVEKDGGKAEIITEGPLKKIVFEPGNRDAVNRYVISYDPVTFEIRNLSVSYTNVPYESLVNMDTDDDAASSGEEDDEKNVINVTEYILEFRFDKKDKTRFDFTDNPLYTLKEGKVVFKGKLAGYPVNRF
jgi:hypothetical protein